MDHRQGYNQMHVTFLESSVDKMLSGSPVMQGGQSEMPEWFGIRWLGRASLKRWHWNRSEEEVTE